MTKPDYTHAKKILTALEEGKTVELAVYSSYTLVGWNRMNNVSRWEIGAVNDPSMIRVKPEPEYVPLEAEDIPAVCWINSHPRVHGATLVTSIGEHRIVTNGVPFYFSSLKESGYFYSEDRKNWKLCRKEKI